MPTARIGVGTITSSRGALSFMGIPKRGRRYPLFTPESGTVISATPSPLRPEATRLSSISSNRSSARGWNQGAEERFEEMELNRVASGRNGDGVAEITVPLSGVKSGYRSEEHTSELQS